MRTAAALVALVVAAPGCSACDDEKPPRPDATPDATSSWKQPRTPDKVRFVWPSNDSKVFTPVALRFAVDGRTVRPADSPDAGVVGGVDAGVDDATGHFHLVIDGRPDEVGEVVSASGTHVHYGDGQTAATIDLAPGPHALTLQFADDAHRALGKDWSTSIDVDVVKAPVAPRVSFVSPAPGARVKSPLRVVFGVDGYTLEAADGDGTDKTAGHHHLIIDGGPVPLGDVVPEDATHLHFDAAEAEGRVSLSPGRHTLTLQFADGAHRAYGPAMAATLEVEVVE